MSAKDKLWLGHIVPKEKSEVAQLYWTTDIPSSEIASAYGLATSAVNKIAGEGIVKHKVFTCKECGFLVKVSSRAEAADKFSRRVDENWRGAPWAAPNLCKSCSQRLRDIQHREFLEGRREHTQRQRELASMPYRDYLQTPEWQATCKGALHRAKYCCQTCASKGELHVHHRTYARRGHEWSSDLIVLCAPCHSLFHQNARLAEGGRAA